MWKQNKNYNDEEVWRYINKVIYKWLHPVLRPGNMRYFEESVIRFRNEDFERRNHIINDQTPDQVIKIELNPDGSVKRISREFKD